MLKKAETSNRPPEKKHETIDRKTALYTWQICNIGSSVQGHSNTRQSNKDIHWQHRWNLQEQIQKSYQIIPTPNLRKQNRTFKAHNENLKNTQKHRLQNQMKHQGPIA